MQQVLFLCTGNYYRSRFAELLFNHWAGEHVLAWRADSAGLALERGVDNLGPMSRTALRELESLGVSVPSEYRFPRSAREQDFSDSQLVVAVKEAEHRPLMEQKFPAWADRIEYWGIHDLDCALPAEALPALTRKVQDLLVRLINESPLDR